MGQTGDELTGGDCAFDIMFEHCKPLVDRIDWLIENGEAIEPDESGSLEAALKVAMLVGLHKARLMRGYPEPDVIVGWRKKFFEVFDQFAEEHWGKDTVKGRRKELKNPFDKLLRICKKEHGL